MEEIFKDIIGYEGLYQISNSGKVKALKREWRMGKKGNGVILSHEEKILKHGFHKKGYKQVVLCKDKKQKTIKIHRLVGLYFVANPDNLPMLNHKDTDKTNNWDWNLEWTTNQDNITHAILNGLRKNTPKRGNHGQAKLVLDLQTGIYYDCLLDAADAKNLNYGTQKNKMGGFGKNNTSLIYV